LSASLRLELSPSPRLALAILGLHGAAAAAASIALPGMAGGLLAAALLALGAASAWSRALLRSSASVRALSLDGPDISFTLRGGSTFKAELAERRYVSRLMVTLPVRRPARRTILVTRDMLRDDAFRALRIWALWGKLPAGVAAKQLPV
jgi:hypothetical protein